MKQATPGARTRGFTLIEVLVAMVVMAIMSLLAWQGVDGIARTREANQARLEQILRLETVIAQWEQDLAALQETTAVPALRCDGQSVRLTRRAEGGMQVVLWTLRPDTGGNVWQRWAGPATATTHGLQDSWLRSQQFQGGEDGLLRALDGVESWQVYFYRGNAWSNCQSSGDISPVTPVTPVTPVSASAPASGAAPTSATTPSVLLPSGVRVVLAFAPGSGLNGNLVRDVLLAP
jgi:general secretion pathway protein J